MGKLTMGLMKTYDEFRGKIIIKAYEHPKITY